MTTSLRAFLCRQPGVHHAADPSADARGDDTPQPSEQLVHDGLALLGHDAPATPRRAGSGAGLPRLGRKRNISREARTALAGQVGTEVLRPSSLRELAALFRLALDPPTTGACICPVSLAEWLLTATLTATSEDDRGRLRISHRQETALRLTCGTVRDAAGSSKPHPVCATHTAPPLRWGRSISDPTPYQAYGMHMEVRQCAPPTL